MPDYKRKIAAIFSADVAGYSRLMGDDESKTVETITAYREVMYSLIKQNRGRVVDSPGDNLLAEFASVVDAAQCGVAIQKEIQARNATLPEDRRMQFRIGINLGDVIEEGERIYGDGVNIAARLEALADPGGICISKTAFDHIESKLPLGYEFIGEQTVKNISRPVFAYKVIMDPRITSGSSVKKNKSLWARRSIVVTGVIAILIFVIFSLILTIPRCSDPQTGKKQGQRPSIVVLPFKNISGNPNQEPFSDGITEELIHSLSRIKGLKVISSTSSFYYKGKDLPLSTIGEELSVEYVLEGSVRKDDKKILIFSQLISVADDTHLFSQRYNREQKDIFNVPEEISKAVVSELKIGLMDTEYEDEEEYSIVEHERRIGINVVIDDNEIITGGLLATGANIQMAGSVKGGLKAYGGNVVISGTSRDVVDFWAGKATLSGNFKDKVKGSGGDIIISGTFEKNLEVHAKHITIASTAVIKGDFHYSGILDRADGSQIEGEIIELDEVNIAPWSISEESHEKSTLLSPLGKIYWDINIIILGILVYFFFPKLKEKILSAISSEPSLKTIGKGLLFLIVSPFIIIFSMFTFVGIPFGFIYSSFLTLVIFAGPVFGCLWVGRKLLNFTKFSFAGNFFISLIAGIIVIRALEMIPFVGWLALVIPFLMGVGAVWHVIRMALKSEREVAPEYNDNSTV